MFARSRLIFSTFALDVRMLALDFSTFALDVRVLALDFSTFAP